jgi:uncharacterized protein (TIGR02413 family)
MTLNILFFTVSINKRKITEREMIQYEMVNKLEEENRYRQATFLHLF